MSVIHPDQMSLFRVRELIKSDELVVAAIDHNERWENWRKVELAQKEIFVSDALFRLSERLRRPVIFLETHLDERGAVVATLAPATGCDALRSFDQFREFLRDAIEHRSQS